MRNYKINGTRKFHYNTNKSISVDEINNFWSNTNKSKKIFKSINLIGIEEGIYKYLNSL